MPHILFWTTSLGRGGAESHLVRLANELSRAGETVEVAVLYPGEYSLRLAESVPFHVLGREAGSVSLGLARSVGPLRRLVRERRPDVVCAVMDLPALFARAALSGMGADGPAFIVSVQNPPVLRHEINWPEISGLAKLYAFVRQRATAATYRAADAIVAISEGVRDDLLRLAPGVAGKTRVIYNVGFDEAVGRDRRRIPHPQPLVVACGRLVHQKGFDVLVEAFEEVRARVPDATLWILGEGERRPELEAQIEAAGLGEAICLKGFQPNPSDYMAAADVFVLSSRFEGFGNVVTEAMSCGTATVATDCPFGPGEIIEHDESGLLVEPESPAALADALTRVLRDDALRERLAASGKRRAAQFGAEESGSQHLDLFESLQPSP